MRRPTIVLCTLLLQLLQGCLALDDFSKFSVEDGAIENDASRPADSGSDAGPCSPEVCNGGDDDCDGTVDEEPTECAFPNAIVGCVSGSCEQTRCVEGFGDCTDEPGCEADLASDPRYCGSCTIACEFGQRCDAGSCETPPVDTVLIGGSGIQDIEYVESTGAVIVRLGSLGSLAGLPLPGNSALVQLRPDLTGVWASAIPSGMLHRSLTVSAAGVPYLVGTLFEDSITFAGETIENTVFKHDAVLLSWDPGGVETDIRRLGHPAADLIPTAVSVRGPRLVTVGYAEEHLSPPPGLDGENILILQPEPIVDLRERQIGGLGDERASDVRVLSDGGYVVIGRFEADIDVGGGSLLTYPVPTNPRIGTGAYFIVRYDSGDGLVWQFAGPNLSFQPSAPVITSDSADNLYLFAGFRDGDTRVGGTPAGLSVSSDERYSILAALAPDGSARWIRRLGEVFGHPPLVATESVVYGVFTYVPSREPDVLGSGEILPVGLGSACAIAAFSSSDGSLLWARSVFGDDQIECNDAEVVGDHLLVVGMFQGTADLGMGSESTSGSAGFLLAVQL